LRHVRLDRRRLSFQLLRHLGVRLVLEQFRHREGVRHLLFQGESGNHDLPEVLLFLHHGLRPVLIRPEGRIGLQQFERR
jgi:hypothetical protein